MWFINLASAQKCYSPGTGAHSIVFSMGLPEVEPHVNEIGTQYEIACTHNRFIR